MKIISQVRLYLQSSLDVQRGSETLGYSGFSSSTYPLPQNYQVPTFASVLWHTCLIPDPIIALEEV